MDQLNQLDLHQVNSPNLSNSSICSIDLEKSKFKTNFKNQSLKCKFNNRKIIYLSCPTINCFDETFKTMFKRASSSLSNTIQTLNQFNSTSSKQLKDSYINVRRRGRCKWFNVLKGWGFITPSDGGLDVFVHQSVIQMSGFRSLAELEEIEFECKKTDKGYEATLVTAVTGHSIKGCSKKTKSKKSQSKKTRCFNCGEFTTHLAAKCDQSPQPKKCHHCKSEDHLIGDCPLRVALHLLNEQEAAQQAQFNEAKHINKPISQNATCKNVPVSKDKTSNPKHVSISDTECELLDVHEKINKTNLKVKCNTFQNKKITEQNKKLVQYKQANKYLDKNSSTASSLSRSSTFLSNSTILSPSSLDSFSSCASSLCLSPCRHNPTYEKILSNNNCNGLPLNNEINSTKCQVQNIPTFCSFPHNHTYTHSCIDDTSNCVKQEYDTLLAYTHHSPNAYNSSATHHSPVCCCYNSLHATQTNQIKPFYDCNPTIVTPQINNHSSCYLCGCSNSCNPNLCTINNSTIGQSNNIKNDFQEYPSHDLNTASHPNTHLDPVISSNPYFSNNNLIFNQSYINSLINTSCKSMISVPEYDQMILNNLQDNYTSHPIAPCVSTNVTNNLVSTLPSNVIISTSNYNNAPYSAIYKPKNSIDEDFNFSSNSSIMSCSSANGGSPTFHYKLANNNNNNNYVDYNHMSCPNQTYHSSFNHQCIEHSNESLQQLEQKAKNYYTPNWTIQAQTQLPVNNQYITKPIEYCYHLAPTNANLPLVAANVQPYSTMCVNNTTNQCKCKYRLNKIVPLENLNFKKVLDNFETDSGITTRCSTASGSLELLINN